MTSGIRVESVSKAFGPIVALDAVSLEVAKGELFGLIGPDGAGKTTLMRILTTVLRKDSGKASVLQWDVEQDMAAIRRNVGYMPGRFSLYQDLTVEENLSFFATLFGTTVQENYELVKDIYVQIEPFKKRRAGQLSGGMKQKLALSCALIHKPEVLFLDEPTTGVDPVSRKEFWEMLARLKAAGITIFVSTPYMDEAGLCDRIALIQNGKILGINTPEGLTGSFSQKLYAVKSDTMYPLIKDLAVFPHTEKAYPFGEFLHYIDKRPDVDEAELREYLEGLGHRNLEIFLTEPTVEDSFIQLMETHE
jgi:ABC-type multidrug transport system ATPase subunit